MGSWRISAIVVAALVLLPFPLLEAAHAAPKTRGKLVSNELSMNVLDGYLIVVQGSIGDQLTPLDRLEEGVVKLPRYASPFA